MLGKVKKILLILLLLLLLTGSGRRQDTAPYFGALAEYDNGVWGVTEASPQSGTEALEYVFSLKDVEAYSGEPYVVLNDNRPLFFEADMRTEVFEIYSELDSLERCQAAYANICIELMPTEPRGEIGMIKPSGWHTVKYNGLVEGNYLYNRCHLIGYQLAGENANERNLITGTRYFNVEGMLPFENEVAAYVRETGNHVLYRVTPEYDGDNLVAHGVRMEAWSVEDAGEGVCFHVFVYNVQPGIIIDYSNGESRLEAEPQHEQDFLGE